MRRTHLITGAAGFIGYHLSERLLARGDSVVGIDNLNDYYDPALKVARLEQLIGNEAAASLAAGGNEASGQGGRFRFRRLALEDRAGIESLFAAEATERGNGQAFDSVINLAAQAGVRYSIDNPHAYIESNLVGFANLLEACRHHGVGHLVYASSSSVYGLNREMPFSTSDNVDHPISLYAATKKANELMAHTYSHLYRFPTTGLRFFTVYGPWGRPDMALFKFTKNIIEGKPIDVYNHGKMQRDFTYIDDIVEGVIRVSDRPPAADVAHHGSPAPYAIYNIGNSQPVELNDFIEAIEESLGMRAERNLLPMQPGDVAATWADTVDLERDCGYRPATAVRDGVARFVEWYRGYFDV